MDINPSQGTLFTVLVPNKWVCSFRKEQMTTGPYFGSGDPIFFCLVADMRNGANTFVAIQDSVDGRNFTTRYVFPQAIVPGGTVYLNLRHWPNYGRVILYSTAWGMIHIERRTYEHLANPGQIVGGFFPPDTDHPDPNNPNHPSTGPESEPPYEDHDNGNGNGNGGEQCTLTVGLDQSKCPTPGDIIAPGIGTFTYDCGTVVPLIALEFTSDKVCCFDQWTGDTGTIGNPFLASTTILVDNNYTVFALYKFCWA